MDRLHIRPARADDDHAILAINDECEEMLSPLNLERLRVMLAMAYRVTVADDLSAMLVAFDQRANYWSPNFAWFRSQYPRFVYIDRVAVTAAARGRGIAVALYHDLIAAARADGHSVVCAEVYSDPPNLVSDAFHERMGFVPVAEVFIPEYGKSVRRLVRQL
jgi:predicted GNAT superfamily acetyltransferase